MDESDKIVMSIIGEIFPEWIEIQKRQYSDYEGYDKYKQIILDTFGYDIERAIMEQERGINVGGLERKIRMMELSQNLKTEEKKKKGKKK